MSDELVRPPRPGRARILRRVRRALRARDAGGADRGARARVSGGARRIRPSRPSSLGCCATTSAARRRSGTRARLQESCGGARMLLKREDLTHTGAHKINNALGQALLAARMGKTPRGRRDRRRPARRGDRHRLRAARPRVRRLHGHRGHARGRRSTSSACGCSGRDVEGVDVGQPHAQGRHQRGDARLGRAARRHALPAGLGARPASVPADGPRVPVGHRPRGAAADASSRSAACPTPCRLRRRRQQRHRHLRRVRRRPRRAR